MVLLSDVLSKVTEKDIMEHYYSCSIKDKKAIYKNLLRNDDKPTCYFNWYRGHYYLVDRGRGRDSNFDCFTLVKSIYNCNFSEALCFINRDMNLNISSNSIINSNNKIKIKKNDNETDKSLHLKINYKVKSRKWNQHDIDYWNQFNINISTLKLYNVIPVSSFESDNNDSFKFKPKYKYKETDPCYAYVFKYDNCIRLKLYRPLNAISKWQGNINITDVFGYEQLPDECNTVYICSSLKDLMCLHEMGFTAIAPQSETSDIPEEIIDNIRLRSKKLIILFDNDYTGIEQSKKYASKYNCRYIVLPHDNISKDVAEYVKNHGLNKTKEIILTSKQLIR
jgi:hypothetical protein